MARMPIFYRLSFNLIPMPGQGSYAVLIFLSEGYPPIEGRLHTRYAPVRH